VGLVLGKKSCVMVLASCECTEKSNCTR
jgi:hypothetical protein